MLHPPFTGAFKNDRKRAGRRGKTLEMLDDLMRRLAREEKLQAYFRDHKLSKVAIKILHAELAATLGH